MTTRLPLRIEPLPGEWWRSYLLRVAEVYGVHPFGLLERVYGIDGAQRRHLRWAGIAMHDPVARRVGAMMNLATDEIQAMHLTAFNGSALHFPPSVLAAMDPAHADESDRLHLHGFGPLIKLTSDRFCPECVLQAPGYRAASWRLELHLICVGHRRLLAVDAIPVDDIDDGVIESQRQIVKRLTPTQENAAFFAHVHAQFLPAIGSKNCSVAQQVHATPDRVFRELRLAVTRAISPGYPDYQGLADWPSATAVRHLRSPTTLGWDGSMHPFPHLLPTNVFTEGISDLLHGLTIRTARAVAAVGATMCATGQQLRATAGLLHGQRGSRISNLLLDNLIQLERQGRAERFWLLCAANASQLLHENVDYRYRETFCSGEVAYTIARTAEPKAYPRTIRTWLVDQWACTYTTTGNPRPSVRDGSIEQFDRLYGPGMRAALERHLAESAA